jgi:hypothetical protein
MNKTLATTIMYALVALALLSGPIEPVLAAEKVADHTAQLTHTKNPTADKRAQKLRAFLDTYNSPLAQEADTFVEEADRYNMDWRLVAAIAGTESTFGKHIPSGSYNAWGWGIPTGAQSGIGFKNWKDGIATVTAGLHKNYIKRGAETLSQIGSIYAASPAWAAHVGFFLDKIDAFTPSDPEFLDVTI